MTFRPNTGQSVSESGEIMKANTCGIWVCQTCMLEHANGEYGDYTPDREPWGLIDRNTEEVTMGMSTEEHADICTPEDREEGCDCEHNPFSWSSCEGCGSNLGGDRYAFTLWFD